MRQPSSRFLAIITALLLSFTNVAPSHSAAAAPAAHASEHDTAKLWDALLAGNAKFMKGQHRSGSMLPLREELANGQRPEVIVVTCSDSRLSPEWIFDQPLGELFVVRTAGNIVDPIALGSIEYAVEHLHAKLLVVMGHSKCGAVDAAVGGGDMPTANLTAIVEKIRPGLPQPTAGATKEATLNAAIEANVRRTARECLDASPIVHEHVASGALTVVQAVYDLASGRVTTLPVTTPATH
jgi:carbonic anhydrase